jgi:protease II
MSYAIAHIRGGDEMGEQWRKTALMKKKNTPRLIGARGT